MHSDRSSGWRPLSQHHAMQVDMTMCCERGLERAAGSHCARCFHTARNRIKPAFGPACAGKMCGRPGKWSWQQLRVAQAQKLR